VYGQAKEVFQKFLEKAGDKPEYAGAVKKTRERMQDMDDTITFLQAGGPSTPAPAAPADSGTAPASSAPPPADSAAPAGNAAPPPPPAK
jgi:hypothetical protein